MNGLLLAPYVLRTQQLQSQRADDDTYFYAQQQAFRAARRTLISLAASVAGIVVAVTAFQNFG